MADEKQSDSPDTGKRDFSHGPTVVGIGASAGGLGALKKFFSQVPVDSGLAFVVVIHLLPEHKSHLADLLQPHARFPVEQVNETRPIEPGHVYIIPPGANLDAIDTHLRLSDFKEHRRNRAPVDHFFRTLANTHDRNAVGVILTGTGSDGTLGLRDIKAKGGIVIVQDPNDAEYDGMPRSAISTGLADLVLPVEEIPAAILRFNRTRPRLPVLADDRDVEPAVGQGVENDAHALLQKVYAHLRASTERDFTHYKHSTVMRRIARRMQLNNIEELSVYLNRLREQPDEVHALSDDLLITVTNFFRDEEVFEKLERDIIPGLLAKKAPGENIRVWSVGCATGEEAYSIAMILLEAYGNREKPPVQIFASDLHARSLQKAREAFYPGDIEADVSPERLRRFFQNENGGYRVRKEVRDLVVFAPHNLLSDPPFSRVDFICCRNLLIYLERGVHQAVADLFHYALNPDGVLLLGSAETMDSSGLFSTIDRPLCFFRRSDVRAPRPRLPVFPPLRYKNAAQTEVRLPSGEISAHGLLHHKLVEQYAPPSLLIGADNKLVHLSDHVGKFLVHPPGEPTADVFQLVREELRIELRALVQAARERRERCASKPIPVQFNGHPVPVVMHVSPALDPGQQGFALIIFEEHIQPRRIQPPHIQPPHIQPPHIQPPLGPKDSPAMAYSQTARMHELETEIDVSRRRLQATFEQYETGQEEMKASNEEMQSANEALRSTMEELETSKEELQSINEELQTVNQENRHKLEELAQLSGDLQNLFSANGIATLFLDRNLRILRFTPKVSELFSVRVTDRGRPLSDLTHRFGRLDLFHDAQEVLDTLAPIERTVQDESGGWFKIRAAPYRSADDRIEGLVITFVDITRNAGIENALRESEKWLSAELRAMQRLHDLVLRLHITPDLTTALEQVLASAIETTGANMGNVQLVTSATAKIVAHQGFDQEFLDYFESVTSDSTSICGRALQSGARVVMEDVDKDEDFAPHRQIAANAGFRAAQATPLISRDGRVRGVLSTHYAQPTTPSTRDLRILDLHARQAADSIERQGAEEQWRQSEERYRLLVESAREYAMFMLDGEGAVVSWNSGAGRIFGYDEREIVGRPGSVLFTEEDRALGIPRQQMKAASEKGQAADDRWHVRKDGSRFWASGAMRPLYMSNGALRGFVKVLRDNTERREAEEASRAQENELRVINDALSRVNADLKQFAIAVSHDLREPLRTASAYSQLLIDASREGRMEEAELAANVILEVNEKMGQLLNDLMTYTQLNVDNGQDRDMVDLNVPLEKTLANLKTIIDQSGALITHDALPTVRGREVYFIQLFQNLIDNAIKYRHQRTPEIHVTAEKIAQEWRLAVSDNGIGIDARFHDQIFEVFKRLHGSQIPGTGFGLAICRRVVERGGGRIWMESKLGQGTTFYFTLPVEERQ